MAGAFFLDSQWRFQVAAKSIFKASLHLASEHSLVPFNIQNIHNAFHNTPQGKTVFHYNSIIPLIRNTRIRMKIRSPPMNHASILQASRASTAISLVDHVFSARVRDHPFRSEPAGSEVRVAWLPVKSGKQDSRLSCTRPPGAAVNNSARYGFTLTGFGRNDVQAFLPRLDKAD